MTPKRWELVVASAAERSLARSPEKAAAAAVELMLGPLLDEPRGVGRPLQRELERLWAACRGPYRIVYERDERSHEVRVVHIAHRADVYRPR